MAFTEDFTAFFDTSSGFAVDATTAGGTVQVIFRNEYDDSLDISTTAPTAEISDSQVVSSGLAYQSSIIIGGDTYYIRDIVPDGTGVSTLILEG